jgi:hypothetical protein
LQSPVKRYSRSFIKFSQSDSCLCPAHRGAEPASGAMKQDTQVFTSHPKFLTYGILVFFVQKNAV